jgi:stage V sporulation protein D (sporulation-specific penicillin-binding protein)
MSAQIRVVWLGAIFLSIGVVLSARLVYFQFYQHDALVERGEREHRVRMDVPARRGDILDRNGHPLAINVMYDTVAVVGSQVKKPDQIASVLSPILEMRPEEILAHIDPASNQAVPIKKEVPAAAIQSIPFADLPGIQPASTQSRHYAEGSLAARTLGFVGTDFHGLAGLENYYDDELSGTPGMLDTESDNFGQEIILGRKVRIAPRDGADIVLTLDRYLQRTTERLLADAVVKNKATGGTIIIMEPATGSIVASATLPTYSLNDDGRFRDDQTPLFRSAMASDQYEPGSVLKLLTMAAGLEDNVVAPDTTINDTGIVTINGVAVRNWNLQGNGIINMTDVLIHSSNIGAQFVAGKLGQERFYDYFDKFGLGKLTGIGLPGEAPGTVRTYRSPAWNRLDLATNSFGQGIAATPIQVITAMSAIANDGVLMKPHLVQEIRRPEGIQTIAPEPVERIISPRTAQVLRGMMVHVLEQKDLEQWRVPGYRTAGKTGTADFAANGGYNTGKTFASVIAFAPAAEPRFAILIRLDAPEKIYGGVVAVPVLSELLPQLYTYARIPPSDAIPGGQ